MNPRTPLTPTTQRASPALRRWRRILTACCLAFALCAPLSAASLTINGDPLRITVADDMSVQVFRNELQSDNTMAYDRQYYSSYHAFLRLTSTVSASPTTTVYSSDLSSFTAQSNTQPDPWTIVTTVTTADNVIITQTISYTNGSSIYRHSWSVNNNGQTNYTGACFRYGGDTFYDNSDRSGGFYDTGLNMVYCTIPGVSGLMGMYADPQTPSSHYYEDGFSAVWSALESPADLPDTVNNNYIDNGCALQWDIGAFTSTQTFTVNAFEKWVASGSFAVTAPAEQAATTGTTVPLSFTVQNVQNVSDNATLTIITSSGISASGPASISLAAGASSPVMVNATIGSSAANTTSLVTLKITSGLDSTVFNQATAVLDVTAPVAQPPAPTPVPAPTIPISRGNQTIYAALCPSTQEGISNLLGALTGRSDSQAVGYAWDALVQDYVKLPTQPSGDGLLVSSGAFVATRVDLGLDFSGTASSLPFDITLQPGWNLIGIPPMDNSGAIITTHQFPADFELIDSTNTVVTTISQFADILGTPGSGDVTTAYPFSYDGTAYQQVSAFQTGRGYWLYNNTVGAPVTLRRMLSAPTLLSVTVTRGVGGAGGSSASSSTLTYRSHGAPPAPPSGAHGDAGGHHCGLGSGVAGLIGLGLCALLRLRSGRRRALLA